jgi:hypothetical protein
MFFGLLGMMVWLVRFRDHPERAVILSGAKDLAPPTSFQILRSAQNDDSGFLQRYGFFPT